MAENDIPTRGPDMEKVEDDRWTSDPDAAEVATRYSEGIGDVDEGTGGISNRPLPEEVERQRNLPDRGKSRNEERDEEDLEGGDVER